MEQTQCALPSDQTHMLIDAIGLLHDAAAALSVEKFLNDTDHPGLASEALWTLCRSGLTMKHKEYLVKAINPGYEWDHLYKVQGTFLLCIGEYLRDNRGSDFECILCHLAGRNDDALLLSHRENSAVNIARMAASIAMGADPGAVVDDRNLENACVARFLTERCNG